MHKIRVEMNIEEWSQDAIRLEGEIENVSRQAFQKGMNQYFRDVLDSPPSCPMKTGWLYDHHELHLEEFEGLFIGTLEITDTPYAIFVHEGITKGGMMLNWTRPGSGPYWITSKDALVEQKTESIFKKALSAIILRWRR